MRINVVSIFPEMMDAIFAAGMLAVAAKKGIVEYRVVSPREFTTDFHRTVDDSPFGGGAGMVMMAPPIVDAVESIAPARGSPVILMGPAGRPFDQETAHRLSREAELTFICGRYKGIDERVRDLVLRILRAQGYSLLEAPDGQQALQLAAGHAGPIHLLLTDVVMPGINGQHLAEQLCQTRSGLKVLFMSGYTDEMIGQHGMFEPGVAFLAKPFSAIALAHKIREVLDMDRF